jgi:FtsH-binding integral membrane protein
MNQQLSIAQQSEAQRSFLTRTFLWMTLGLVVTAVVAVVVASSPTITELVFGNPWIMFGLLFAQLGVVIFLSVAIGRLNPVVATLVFLGYAALTGVVFSTLILYYTAESIASTFVVTAGLFGILSIIGLTTKVDLTAVGTLAFIGLIGVILMSLVNIFLQSTTLYWIISVLGVIVFVVLIARDAQRLKQMSTQLDVNSDSGARASVMGALQLYLDFINLFLFLMRIMGRRS